MILPSTLIDGAKASTDFVFVLIKLNKFRAGNCSLSEESLATKVYLFKKMKKSQQTHREKQSEEHPVTVGKMFAALILPRF